MEKSGISDRAIYIAGDICPTTINEESFRQNEMDALVSADLADLLHRSIGVVANLETPLTTSYSPIRKAGPALRAHPDSASALKAMNIVALGLANNHIMDQGVSGLFDTVASLDDAQIKYFGAGANQEGAQKPFILECGDCIFGFYACAEHEFSTASAVNPGANPFSEKEAHQTIKNLAEVADYVVVLFHGLSEYYQYPSPNAQRRCRAFIDAGANLVTCQHSHCIGCEELYRGGRIVYGQGDFHFAMGDENPLRREGLLIRVDCESRAVSYVPVENFSGKVALSQGSRKKEILDSFWARSEEIKDASFVQSAWSGFCRGRLQFFEDQIMASMRPRILRVLYYAVCRLNRRSAGFRSGESLMSVVNALRCEAQNEEIVTALLDISNER